MIRPAIKCGPGNGTLVLTGTYVAENPLAAEVVRTVNINMNDPVDDGSLCCSDTLSIIQIGAPGGPVALTCPPPGQVPPLPGGIAFGENVNFAGFDLFVNAISDPFPNPGPIVGAGLPGLILACGVLMGLARRGRQLVA